ncbi:MAG: hypothetical protein RR214_00940 [Synergistaceae bacterium]
MAVEPIVVKKSEKSAVRLTVLAFGMTLLCVCCLFTEPSKYGFWGSLFGWLAKSGHAGIVNFIDKSLAVFGTLFCGAGFVISLRGLRSKEPVLVVDDKGVTDRSSALSFGFIP